ncbi:LLM class flavin-dependent oxidoreductase [Novosphingobium resinovorum]|uniref:LLM class flavin-dependent oxidoreductase n=1 Tax=Novosphingobium TaxID=165696 RepID=UPI0020050691|nr:MULTISPECIES: LLM class flavin-dependent oxidoreductase [Novosphingobium]WJM24754.1 LLM class flavin-dependent oxidoreductase [Novosphingobium resinovorum]
MTQDRGMVRPDHFKLGTFATNCSGGMSVTTVPERWNASWENNLRLAKMLDEAGIDFMLPIARWIGYGGETDFHGSVLETMTWASALLASTRNITVFATIHTAVNHPVVIAKQIATIDRISGGRAGLNIVAGWNEPEYRALGLKLAADHETRYEYAQEWFDVVQALWSREGRFDWEGKHFQLEQIHSDPKPVVARPPIINAAGSAQGRDFAVRNADFLFTPAIDLSRSAAEVAELHKAAAEQDRSVEVLTFSHVVCRPTEAEAKDYVAHFTGDALDSVALDNLVNLQFAHAQSFPHDLLALIRDRMGMGHGGVPLIGTPEQVAEGLIGLHRAGFGGTTLSFVDYAQEFPYFRDTVLPLLEAEGIRTPAAKTAVPA